VRLSKPDMETKTSPTYEQLLDILRAAPRTLRNPLATLAYAGIRAGELRRLRREDLDFDGKWIHIVSRENARTKNGKSRRVPMHPALQPILAEQVEAGRPLVFGRILRRNEDGDSREVDTKRMNDDFKILLVALGLPVGRKDGFTLHALRRFFETICVNSHVPQQVVDRWMGHSLGKSMGARHYYTPHDADQQRFMASLHFTVPIAEAEASSK